MLDVKRSALLDAERESPADILDFAGRILGISLFPAQAFILKTFYDSGCKELLMVLGKKSGKDFMAAIIGLYENYRLLLLKPNPSGFFKLLKGQKIYVLNVATRKAQAQHILLDYAKKMVGSSAFLKKFLPSEESEFVSDEIRFESDLVFRAQPCTATASLGYTCALVLFDEFAFFADSQGVGSSREVYDSLIPNLRPVGDFGKSVIITSPNGKDNISYEMAEDAMEGAEIVEGEGIKVFVNKEKSIVYVNAPTWKVNPRITFESLRRAFARNPEKARADWGAEFLDVEGLAFSREKLRKAFKNIRIDLAKGDNRERVIYMDPGIKHDAYALAMGYREEGRVIVDYVHYWQGSKESPVQISEVEEHVRALNRNFRIFFIGLDQYQSASTIQKLEKEGLPIKEIHATPTYNLMAYTNLIEKINMETVDIVDNDRLVGEMTVMRRSGSGLKVKFEAPTTGIVTSDDGVDAVSGCVLILSQMEDVVTDDYALDGLEAIDMKIPSETEIEKADDIDIAAF